jgi:ATP-dependent DNA helicase RecQ
MHGRFGKNMVAQMLCGSRSKKLQQWKLHRLSTYGMLSELKQTEVVAVIDALVEGGLLIQREVDDRRPTIDINEAGKRVMHAVEPLPSSISMSFPLAKRLAMAARGIESRDVPQQSAAAGGDAATAGDDDDCAAATELRDRLKRWRRKTSAALGIPAYRVLTNATIERIADMMPTDSEQLEAVSGIGAATMEQYGYDILQLVGEVAANSGQSSPPSPPPDGRPRVEQREEQLSGDSAETSEATEDSGDPTENGDAQQRPSHYWTWRLFCDGYSATQIVQIRRCEAGILLEELQAARRDGLEVRAEWDAAAEECAFTESAQSAGQ